MKVKKSVLKSVLKSGYYYEFKKFYDDLPEMLPVPRYLEYIFPKDMTHQEIRDTYVKKEFTREQAFAVAADYAADPKHTEWRIVYFMDTDGTPCRLDVWRYGVGQLLLSVIRVVLDDECVAGDGALVSNENSEPISLMSSLDSLSLESLAERVEKLESLVEHIKSFLVL